MASISSGSDLLERACALAPAIRAARADIDRDRALPPSLIAALRERELFHLWLPRALGGAELHPKEFVGVIESLAAADGAVGWCATNASVFTLLAGSMDAVAAQTIFGQRGVVAGSLNPTGRADAVAGGYRATGRWSYVSGITHADWVLGTCIVHETVGPRHTAVEGPELRFLFFPRSAVDIIDTWNVSGLKGTGSHDVQVDAVFVESAFTVPAFRSDPHHPDLLYRLAPVSLFAASLACVVLGIARSAIDALIELAAAKTPMGSASVLRDRPTVQVQVARAESMVRAARAHLLDALGRAWDHAAAARPPTPEIRATVRLATSFCAEACAVAVDLVHSAAGGSAIDENGRIARCFRDIHAATQHIGLSAAGYELSGRVIFGLPLGTDRF